MQATGQYRSIAAALLLGACLFVRTQATHAETFQTCAGFIETLPTTISTQGVWCLRQDMSTTITSGAAITVATNNVTIDCNDFKVGGLAGGNSSTAYGIYAYQKQNIAIRHCGIRGFNRGVALFYGSGHLIEDNRLDNNLYAGIFLLGTETSMVRRNRVYDTGGATDGTAAVGIEAPANIVDNDVQGVFTSGTTTALVGILLDSGIGFQASGNRVSGLASSGGAPVIGILVTARHATVAGNHLAAGAANTNGEGIGGYNGSDTFCMNNTIAKFSLAISTCQDAGGNASH